MSDRQKKGYLGIDPGRDGADSALEWKLQREQREAIGQAVAVLPGLGNLGVGQLSGGYGQQNPQRQAPFPFGVLYMDGAPLPENWRGAEYTKMERAAGTECWQIIFRSEWAAKYIVLHLDLEKYSGEEVNKIAETYLAAINQRRVG